MGKTSSSHTQSHSWSTVLNCLYVVWKISTKSCQNSGVGRPRNRSHYSLGKGCQAMLKCSQPLPIMSLRLICKTTRLVSPVLFIPSLWTYRQTDGRAYGEPLWYVTSRTTSVNRTHCSYIVGEFIT